MSYVTETVGGVPVFVRNYCEGGTSSTVSDTSTMSNNLKSLTSVVVPPLICNSTFDDSCSTDASNGVISSLDVATVEIDVTESSGFGSLCGFSPASTGVDVRSRCRRSAVDAAGLARYPAGAQCGTGNQGLSVNGVLAVNSSQGGVGHRRDSGTDRPTGVLATHRRRPQTSEPGTALHPAGRASRYAQYATGPALSDPYSELPGPVGADTFVYTQPLTSTTGNDPPGSSNLKSGTYVLKDGIDASSLTSDAGGVFFYVTKGPVTLGGSSGLNVSAMATGPYAGVLLYQVPSDASPLVLAGTPSINSLDGVIDASTAPVTLSGGARSRCSGSSPPA